MKVIIAGGRDFNNEQMIEDTMAELDFEVTEVVCGGARGADTLGRWWAVKHGIPVKLFPAEWEMFGNYAGIKRNHDMGDYADYLVAFWDGKSTGTRDMINYMEQIGKHGIVKMYQKGVVTND